MKEGWPFAHNPIETRKGGVFMRLKEFEDNPKYAIKETRIWGGIEMLKQAQIYQRDYKELKEQYGNVIPETFFVLAKDAESRTKVYAVQEKIIGDTLSPRILQEHQELRVMVEEFLQKLIEEFMKSYDASKDVGKAPDLKAGNLMFGHKSEVGKGELYFVDVSPGFLECSRNDVKFNIKIFMESLRIPPSANMQTQIEKLDALNGNVE